MVEIKVDVEAFNTGLRTLEYAFGKQVALQYKKMMSDIEHRAKRRAPVRTGAMRAGIWWRVDIDSQGHITGLIGSHAKYGKYTEFVDKPGGRIQRASQRGAPYRGSGTVSDPFTMWPARLGRGSNKRGQWGSQTMPWLRPSVVEALTSDLHRRLTWAFRGALRVAQRASRSRTRK